jgi:hypothetical protein
LAYQKTWDDPAPGTVIQIPAGETLDLGLTCVNDAEKVVTFTARVDGLGPWAPASEPRLPVVPFESGVIRVPITSSPSAEPGDYPFSVHLFLNGEPVEDNGSVALVMRLTPSEVQVEAGQTPREEIDSEAVGSASKAKDKPKKAKSKPKEVIIPEELTAPSADVPATVESKIESGPAEPVVQFDAETPTIQESSVVGEPKLDAIEVEAESPVPEATVEEKVEIKAEPAEPTGNGQKLIDTAPPIPTAKPQPKPEPRPEPEPEPEPEPIPAPIPVVTTEAVPSTPKVVDYGVREEEPEELADVAEAYPADHVFANPKEGTVLYARPGESILVRFSVNNDQSGVRTFVLQEDRSLDSEWIQLVRDQVNITPGGTGDLAFMLRPPIHAEPASYPFAVSFGVLGKPLSNCYLILTVQAAPAVTVEAKRTAVSVGPFSRSVPFEIQVESAGNADTAYRLAVIDDSPGPDGKPQDPIPVYETTAWQYLFDKEIDTLQSPSAGRTPPPMPHRLRLHRKGTWWLGWREKHKVKVATVPVTDQKNNLKTGNILELTGARWRIFPLPMFLMIPLAAIALILLGSGGSNLRVTNGVQGDDGAFYVLGTEPNQAQLPIKLKWEAPVYAMLRLNRQDQGKQSTVDAGRLSAEDKTTVQGYGQAQKIGYNLASKFFGSGITADVRVVPQKTEGKLQILDNNVPISSLAAKETIGEDKVAIESQEISLVIPQDGAKTIRFVNLTGTGGVGGQTIVAWTIRPPQGFRIENFLIKDGAPINPGARLAATIKVDADNPPTEGEGVWELVTTDAKSQLIRIKLKVAE